MRGIDARMRRTQVDEALAAAELEHADDPGRAELLARARRFKASWLELGEALTEVRRNGQWQHWGHASFEEYARKELRLRPDTADKLTASYGFLAHHAPAVLERDGVEHPIPSYQAVDFLRRAEEREDAPPEVVAELRRRVIDEAAPLPAVSRKYREIIFPAEGGERRSKDQAALRATARRLAELLATSEELPQRVLRETRAAIDRLLDALERSSGDGDDEP